MIYKEYTFIYPVKKLTRKEIDELIERATKLVKNENWYLRTAIFRAATVLFPDIVQYMFHKNPVELLNSLIAKNNDFIFIDPGYLHEKNGGKWSAYSILQLTRLRGEVEDEEYYFKFIKGKHVQKRGTTFTLR